MPQNIRRSDAELPTARQSTPHQVLLAKRLSMAPRFSDQPPFDIINGVAYPRDGCLSIDYVILFLCCSRPVSFQSRRSPRNAIAF